MDYFVDTNIYDERKRVGRLVAVGLDGSSWRLLVMRPDGSLDNYTLNADIRLVPTNGRAKVGWEQNEVARASDA